jgi:hypothetical protein
MYLYVALTNTIKHIHVNRNKKLTKPNNNKKRDHKAGACPLPSAVQRKGSGPKNKIKN